MGLARFAATTALMVGFASPTVAGVYVESGDAGELLHTAADTVGTGPLESIQGIIEEEVEDIDLFKIVIDDPTNFSATLQSDITGIADGYLFLFDENGNGVVADNEFLDSSNLSNIAQITSGSLGVGDSGTYYIAVSEGSIFGIVDESTAGDLPRFASNPGDLIFTAQSLGDDFFTLDSVQPAVTDSPLLDWQRDGEAIGGTYQIQLTGATFAQQSVIPEPASIAIWSLLGLVAAVGVRRRF